MDHKSKRGRRRRDAARAKRKARRLLNIYLGDASLPITDRMVGSYAETHSRPCSCWMCGNPRRHLKGKDGKTRQVLKADLGSRDLDRPHPP